MTAQINFYHTRFRKKHLLLPLSRMLAIVFLATLSIPALLIFNNLQVQKIAGHSAQLQQDYSHMEAEWAKIQNTLAQKDTNTRLAAEATKLETILAYRSELMQLIRANGFEPHKGYSDYLIALARQHIDKIWLTRIGITQNGSSLNIEGKTTDAVTLPVYLNRLSDEPTLSGIQLEILRLKHDSNTPAANTPLHFVVATSEKNQ